MTFNWQQIKPYIEKLNFFTALVIVFLFPLFKKAVPPVIGFWVLTWLLEFNYLKRFSITSKYIFFTAIAFYLFHAISLLYSTDLAEGFFDMEVKLTLFIFPLLMTGANFMYKKHFDLILLVFLIANITATLICIFFAFNSALSFENGSLQFSTHVWMDIPGLSNYYNPFSYFIFSKFLHVAYFSMYLAFCIIICFYFFEKKMRFFNVLIYFLIPYFLLIIYFLSSRAGLITIAVILFGYVIYFLFFSSIRKKTIIILVVISGVFLYVLIKNNSRVNYGLQQLKETTFSSNTKALTTPNDRLLIWYNSLPIVKDNFILGVGIGDVKNNLKDSYAKNDMEDALKNNLNSHNQYLETLIGLGLIGLLMLLAMFFIPAYIALKKRNILVLFFLIVIGINFLFETMLNTQAGAIFFAFFYSLFMFRNPELFPDKELHKQVNV